MDIPVLYHDKEMPKLAFIGGDKSDWVDVRASKVKVNGKEVDWIADRVHYKAGDLVVIDLGISIELPEGHEAYLLPRSSTYKNYGFILVNGMGVIDESYRGKDDHWMAQYVALRDGVIEKYDRVGQFRVMEKMSRGIRINLNEVDELLGENRSGLGSSGNK